MTRSRQCSKQTLRLLDALLESPRAWRHGYELSKVTELKSGSLYPILIRLGDRGLLESKWEPSEQPGRPPRHLYRLTPKGAAFAREQLATGAPATGALRAGGRA